MPSHAVDWRSAVAEKVYNLVRDGRVLARFRAQCAAFLDERKRDEAQLGAWKQRRKNHCLKGLRTLANCNARWKKTERLGGNRKAIERTRPKKDTEKTWIFEYLNEFLSADDLTDLKPGETALVRFAVWVPPDLSALPKLTVPPLFGRLTGHLHAPEFGTSIEPGKASWAEKYASLAAIHDARFPHGVPIHELSDINCRLFTERMLPRAPRESLREIVGALPIKAEVDVRAWLRDVKADLVEQVGPPGRANRTGDGQGDGTVEGEGTFVWFRDHFWMPLIVVVLGALLAWWIGIAH
jgi:hypothetical protein